MSFLFLPRPNRRYPFGIDYDPEIRPTVSRKPRYCVALYNSFIIIYFLFFVCIHIRERICI
jgi:hypothetical protein